MVCCQKQLAGYITSAMLLPLNAACVQGCLHSGYVSAACAARNFPTPYTASRIPCTCILDKGQRFDFPLWQNIVATNPTATPYELWCSMYKKQSMSQRPCYGNIEKQRGLIITHTQMSRHPAINNTARNYRTSYYY